MSRFGLAVLLAGIALSATGIGTMLVGVTINSDPMIFFGGLIFAVGAGFVVCAFYVLIRGIYAKLKELAEASRFMAKILERFQASEKGA